jgi:putative DNA primase/helicase
MAMSPHTAGDPSNLTDVGNAARFARDHSGRIRYSSKLGFLEWDGTRWRPDDVGQVERLARETIRSLYREASESEVDETRKRLAKWATESESRSAVRAMLDLARSEYGIATRADGFDHHPWLLNTLTATVDLKTSNEAAHDPGNLITKLAPTFYRPEAPCPRWLTFLDRIMGGDLSLVEFLQRAVGYSLTGDTKEQVLFMLYGTLGPAQEQVYISRAGLTV